MTLRKITSCPASIWLGRGTQGQTMQEVAATRTGDRVRLTVRHAGREVAVELDPEEAEALRAWLVPVPSPHSPGLSREERVGCAALVTPQGSR